MQLGRDDISLGAFSEATDTPVSLMLDEEVMATLARDRAVVEAAVAGPDPVYGLNTGLGANLGHRIDPADIPAFQRQLIEGRAVAVGPLLPEATGRGVLLARLISAAMGGSGISVPLFDHLRAIYASGFSPAIPAFGSIGAGDLTQNAVWALATLGTGQMWLDGQLLDAGEALAAKEIDVPALQPKDAMALINHGGLSATLSAQALQQAQQGLAMSRAAVLLGFVGYGVNTAILSPDINALRPSPGQAETAAWFWERLQPGQDNPRRIQDAISFRAIAPVLGAAQNVVDQATHIWQDEVNGLSDSPVVLADQAMRSTPNFHAPALALALEGAALALAMVASGSVQRIQRMMSAELSGLPRYLTPVGGASAGMVPIQKTAAALMADIRRHAMPVAFDPAPVSEMVEDVAPMTPQAATKLGELCSSFAILCGVEAMVAAQAVDLRKMESMPPAVSRIHKALRGQVAMLNEDRPLSQDMMRATQVLRQISGTL